MFPGRVYECKDHRLMESSADQLAGGKANEDADIPVATVAEQEEEK